MKEAGPERNEPYLSLSAAARLLGVHPSTVRAWADQGRIPVYRTQGGHRRFKSSEMQLWKQSLQAGDTLTAERMLQQVLVHMRLQISEVNLQTEIWYAKLDGTARDQYRQTGRALSEGLTGYLITQKPQGEAQAQAIGREYAIRGRRCGLNRMEATQAFLFFQGALLDALLRTYAEAHVVSPCAWGEMLRKTRCYTDLVLIAFLGAYEAD
jgi:excisionase family DNA binding protein